MILKPPIAFIKVSRISSRFRISLVVEMQELKPPRARAATVTQLGCTKYSDVGQSFVHPNDQRSSTLLYPPTPSILLSFTLPCRCGGQISEVASIDNAELSAWSDCGEQQLTPEFQLDAICFNELSLLGVSKSGRCV
ncbi:hypothetical protein EGR_03455 [Echinococcus granulosus]|uniref:Uncharacterized protein n=1 Tax=Echinococcus granulosus TaxID=6210 RepID=W6UKE8_ECHGR|nr:hypothetical protein EGR_03455 [Echinococcus granulosus]EUB61641.1 hypothetical protein EGR_03455 [Echinococcus granulosus]